MDFPHPPFASMMKWLVKRVLRRFGLELRRLPPEPGAPSPAPPRVDAGEVARLEEALAAFAAGQPAGDDLADMSKIRAYLSDERIAFFHEVLRVAGGLGASPAGRRVADVGSGTGYLLRLIGEGGDPAELVGFDTLTRMNELARALCPRATILDASPGDVGGPFDVVYCTEVLEHLVDPAAALRRMAGHLAPSGSLVLTVPDGRRDRKGAGDLRADGSAYWGHVHFWSPESWPLFLRSALGDGFRIRTRILSDGKNLAVVSRARPPAQAPPGPGAGRRPGARTGIGG